MHRFYLAGILLLLLAGIASAGSTSYIHGSDGQLLAQINETNITYYHSDHLGSSSAMTNEGGAVIFSAEYLPFGEQFSGSGLEKYQFIGKGFDSDLSLNYFGMRYYSPATGRFISIDPFLEDFSPYPYAGNNPLNTVDPTGGSKKKLTSKDILDTNPDLRILPERIPYSKFNKAYKAYKRREKMNEGAKEMAKLMAMSLATGAPLSTTVVPMRFTGPIAKTFGPLKSLFCNLMANPKVQTLVTIGLTTPLLWTGYGPFLDLGESVVGGVSQDVFSIVADRVHGLNAGEVERFLESVPVKVDAVGIFGSRTCLDADYGSESDLDSLLCCGQLNTAEEVNQISKFILDNPYIGKENIPVHFTVIRGEDITLWTDWINAREYGGNQIVIERVEGDKWEILYDSWSN